MEWKELESEKSSQRGQFNELGEKTCFVNKLI
jgi:hypothetical protein